jgi:hypothetical protein
VPDTDNEQIDPAREETMSNDLKKRLFRFNTVRPVQPRSERKAIIEYSGELTDFLSQVQKLDSVKQVQTLAKDTMAKYDFFAADKFENTELWPLIHGMKTAYSLQKGADGDAIKDALNDAFNDFATKAQLKALIDRKNDIWDQYVISMLVKQVTDKQRAALVDSLRAVELLQALSQIDNYRELHRFLINNPVLPAWLVAKIAGQFRERFPFVIGVTDLLVVKEDWERYERAEIAHIENVMASEHRTRTHRQLDREETTTTFETERIEETMKETSSSIHSAMSQEIEATISQENGLAAGTTVSASYGPSVSVDTNASFDFTTASEETTTSAQEYAQDLVERAVASVSNRERNETVTVVLSEEEETHVQIYTNTDPNAEHIVGVYRHLDQVWRAQVFNYGRRLMLDFVVPEPSVNWRLSREEDSHPDDKLEKPKKLDLSPKLITPAEYQNIANEWGASNVPAPPDETLSVSKAIELEIPKFNMDEASSVSMATEQLQIPEGYLGTKAYVNFFADSKKENNDGKDDAKIVINGTELDIESGTKSTNLSNHTGTLEFGVYIDFFEGGVASVRVDCVVSPETYAKWQNDVYDALKAANDKDIDAYNAAKKNKEALSSVQQETLHPDIKKTIEHTELKRSAISILASHNYEQSGALHLEYDDDLDLNFPAIHFQEARIEGKVARFFEEAFEWPEMTYLYYPYFWARRSEWFKLMSERDPDFKFNAFLQSGAARVNLAVRPGFEAAVLWYMATGEVWMGGPVPVVGDPLYVALIDEIVESKGRTLDNPKPVGSSWTYSVPTSLVVLDPDDRLIPPPEAPEN